jgi:hypothetical protein
VLTYLDQRPVDDKERAAIEAYLEGGPEAEKALREQWANAEKERIHQGVIALMK